MPSTLNHTALRATKDIPAFLRQALTDHGAKAVTQDLLAATETEALPPSVLSLWLQICYDTDTISACMKQQLSRTARLSAIKAFLKVAGSERLEATWTSVGGTTGFAQLLAGLAVEEVQDICRGLGSLGFRERHKAVIRQKVSDLYKILSSAENPDQRPLQHHYDLLLLACDDVCLLSYFDRTSVPMPRIKKVMLAHPELFQKLLLESLHVPDAKLRFDPAPLFKDSAPDISNRSDLLSCRQLAIRVLVVARSDPQLKEKESMLTTAAMNGALKWLGRRRRNHASAADLQPMRLLVAALQQRGQPSLVETVAQLWRRSVHELQDILVSVISYASAQQPADCLPRILQRLPSFLRLRFAKLMYLHARSSKTDIDNDSQLSEGKAKFDARTFLMLEKAYALSLLEKLETLCDSVPITQHCSMETETPLQILLANNDWDPLLRLILLRGTTEGLTLAKTKIEEQKKNATRQHDAFARGVSARAMLTYATAAGSLDLFTENLKWSRRFDKDHSNASSFYSQSVFNASTIDLLSGFPADIESKTTIENIAENVKKGDAVLLAVLDAGCAAAKEPSFTSWEWASSLSHLPRVVHARLKIAPLLQTKHNLTDDEVHNVLWKGLLAVCSTYQDTIYDLHNETLLKACNTAYPTYPPFFGHFLQLRKGMLIPASSRFLNDLMVMRDGFWQKHRQNNDTNVLTLPPAWPRGLAVQQLLPCVLDSDTPTYTLPLLVQRAEKVVFMPADVANAPLPTDKSSIAAIGCFIDSYEAALQIWTMSGVDEDERRSKKRAAFEHALSFGAGSVHDSSFWYRHFNEPMPVVAEPNIEPLPSEDETAPVEWNPQPGLPDDKELTQQHKRKLFIDACFNTSTTPGLGNESAEFNIHYVATTPTQPYKHMFGVYNNGIRSDDPRARETPDVAALLAVEAYHRLGDKLLSRPFPSVEDVRYPAVYLDSQFYEHRDFQARQAMSRLCNSTTLPTTLILRLVSSLLAAAEGQKQSADTEIAAFDLVRNLIDGDRPQVALEHVKKLFSDLSDHSARHRQILTTGLLRRLPPSLVRALLFSVCETISQRLQQKRDAPAGSDTGPVVKISSIKAVVQVLADCDAVSTEDALSMLQMLLMSSRHVDVRTAIIGNLQSILLESKDRKMQETILGLFKSLVPVAASLDERVTMTEEAWASAEATGKMPSIEVCGVLMPSLMTALIQMATTIKNAKPELSSEVMERILMPILQLSTQNQKRWTGLLMKTLQVSSTGVIPAVPVYPAYIGALCTAFTEAIPTTVFETLTSYVKARYSPSSTILKITERIKQSRAMKESESGKYWLSIWQDDKQSRELVQTARFLLKRDEVPVSGNVTTVEHIQAFWTECAMLYLGKPRLYPELTRHIDALEVNLTAMRRDKAVWMRNCRPLLMHFAARIETLRTSAWQLNTQRQPPALPDAIDLRLMLLSYPHLPYIKDEEQKSIVFVDEILLILQTVVDAGKPYHHVLPKLRKALYTVTGTAFREDVFYRLANIDSIGVMAPPLMDWLRLELACALLEYGSSLKVLPTSASGKRLTQLVQQLAKSPVEDFRAYVKQLEKHFAVESWSGRHTAGSRRMSLDSRIT